MIELMEDLPDHVLGFKVSGTVTADEYESVVIPAVEAFFLVQPKAHFMYCFSTDFEGFEAGAVWDDVRLGLRHISGWEKVAVVADQDWLRGAVKIVRLGIPGDLRVYTTQEMQQARAWVES